MQLLDSKIWWNPTACEAKQYLYLNALQFQSLLGISLVNAGSYFDTYLNFASFCKQSKPLAGKKTEWKENQNCT